MVIRGMSYYTRFRHHGPLLLLLEAPIYPSHDSNSTPSVSALAYLNPQSNYADQEVQSTPTPTPMREHIPDTLIPQYPKVLTLLLLPGPLQ